MGSANHVETPPAPSRLDSSSPETVRAHLERLLASPLFRGSRRCQALLRHVVERTLARDTASLKERSLGIDVFGRPADYDTNAEPIVRATAGEIRKKLAQYYQGSLDPAGLRIVLNPGSYVPEFHTPEVPAARPRPHFPTAVVAAAGLAVALLAGVALLLHLRASPLERFWRPMLDSPRGTLFCVGQPRPFNFRSEARQQQIERQLTTMAPGAIEASPELIPLGQLVPMWDRYLTLGDAACLLRLTAMFERRGKPYRIRGEASTTLADLREQPAVLIGAFNNDWTLRSIGAMRYTFSKDYHGLDFVRDSEHPEKRDWKLLNAWPAWNIANDYAIVSRVFDVTTQRTVVVAAGFTHFGTEAAGEFLTDPRYLGDAIARLPANWESRNLQIVLRVPVVRGDSGHPQVLATHLW